MVRPASPLMYVALRPSDVSSSYGDLASGDRRTYDGRTRGLASVSRTLSAPFPCYYPPKGERATVLTVKGGSPRAFARGRVIRYCPIPASHTCPRPVRRFSSVHRALAQVRKSFGTLCENLHLSPWLQRASKWNTQFCGYRLVVFSLSAVHSSFERLGRSGQTTSALAGSSSASLSSSSPSSPDAAAADLGRFRLRFCFFAAAGCRCCCCYCCCCRCCCCGCRCC